MNLAPPHPPIKVLWPALVFLAVVLLYIVIDVIGGDGPPTLPDPPPPTVDIAEIAPPQKNGDPVVVVLQVTVPKVAPVTFGKSVAELMVVAWAKSGVVASGKATASSLQLIDGVNDVAVSMNADIVAAGVTRLEAVLRLDYTRDFGGGGLLTANRVHFMTGVTLTPDKKAEFNGGKLTFPLKVSKFAGTAMTVDDPDFDMRSVVYASASDGSTTMPMQAALTNANFKLRDGRGVFSEEGDLRDAEALITMAAGDFTAPSVSLTVSLWIDGRLLSSTATYEIE